MKAGYNSQQLFGLTRAKGKMYEFGLHESQHRPIPQGADPLQLFLLTVGTLGDISSALAVDANPLLPLPADLQSELNFSASFFDAILDSQFASQLERPTLLLAAAAYYIARRPGSSLVLARRVAPKEGDNKVENLLQWLLRGEWGTYWRIDDERYESSLTAISSAVANYFSFGYGIENILQLLNRLRQNAYRFGTPEELLYADMAIAICRMRLSASSWSTLPTFTGLPADRWGPTIQKNGFPKELWPSQLLLGNKGIFMGASGLIQMPTSAGKTRSVEIILRSAFMSGRTKLAVVVAPFRALCHEIAVSFKQDFTGEDIKVNELSDALQIDFIEQISELFGSSPPSTSYVLVLTPEKFLYVLRQAPNALKHVGLVVYDEGHQFDTGGRGITYELLLTEIKEVLPEHAQTVLISAVMQNPDAIAKWLMGEDKAQVIDGAALLPTSRSVAFASWTESLGQLMFYENGYTRQDYSVPNVIESVELLGLEPDKAQFPSRLSSTDISLYLGLRVANQGAVAIFCGTKVIANGIAKRAMDIADAGYHTAWPVTYANRTEVAALSWIISGNFGEDSQQAKAAKLGIYTHHSNTPHGLRLALEYGMQKRLINFIACTSTLAQGVNLPIRYLIVHGVNQGSTRVKVRDFQNLIGRAGRAGMHTEGIVLFADSKVYDTKLQKNEAWRFRSAVDLLSPDRAEGVTSSLLMLLEPLTIYGRHEWSFSNETLLGLMDNESAWEAWSNDLVRPISRIDASKKTQLAKDLRTALASKRDMTHTVESYLMANCSKENPEEFIQRAGELSLGTLAHHLATPDQAKKLEDFFKLVAARIIAVEKSPEKQASFGKTLLGAKHAQRIENWVNENRGTLLPLSSNEEWLAAVWPLFSEICDNRFFRSVEPKHAGYALALSWIQGTDYGTLFKQAAALGAKKKSNKRNLKVSDDDVLDFLESALAFDCALILAALAQFLFTPMEIVGQEGSVLAQFQRSLKNGLPDTLSLSAYEAGFSDRFIAQAMRDVLRSDGYDGDYFGAAKEYHLAAMRQVANQTPAYFHQILGI
ncbi:DEAD/DEAH box helicase [Herbaspirillum camelliae]|uniref:DEAD/DEAH box helicase n=1 Tax=Herbaspirillum camelliae TaxID=1892903 RepID=UPI00094A07DE|nr:DEAD/DEAH box helicase [Herbaspirillum camelliae]